MRPVLPFIAISLVLSGCNPFGWGPDDTERSLPFRADIAVADNRQDLVIAVEAPPGTPVEVVRETARYQATRYCLQRYGDSDASWQTDPATGDWAFTRTPETMIFRAECEGR